MRKTLKVANRMIGGNKLEENSMMAIGIKKVAIESKNVAIDDENTFIEAKNTSIETMKSK